MPEGEVTFIAKKGRSFLYFDRARKEFMAAEMVGQGVRTTYLGRDYLKAGAMTKYEGYSCFKGIFIDPIEEKLVVLPAIVADLTTASDKIAEKMRELENYPQADTF